MDFRRFLMNYKRNKLKTPLLLLGILFIYITLFIMAPTLTSYASTDQQEAQQQTSQPDMVYDYANLFSPDEISELEDLSRTKGQEGQVNIVFITTYDLDGKTRKEYIEDLYDNSAFGQNGEYSDTALILLNMDPADRGVEIQGYGMAEHYLHNDRIEHMLDDIVPLLSDEDYFLAMEEFANQVAYYMNEDKGVNTNPVYGDETSGSYYGEASVDGESDYYGEESFLDNILVRIIISLVIGGVAVGIMAYNSSGKVSTNNNTYLDQGNSRLVARRDRYIRTSTTRVKKPKENSSNSGGRSSGGGGRSSGGSSHSGGGRGF